MLQQSFEILKGPLTTIFWRAVADRGIDRAVVRWINSMLRNRPIELTLGETINEAAAITGFPQSDVISPLLLVDILLVKINQAGYYVQAYADVLGKFLGHIAELTQMALNRTSFWCEERSLKK